MRVYHIFILLSHLFLSTLSAQERDPADVDLAARNRGEKLPEEEVNLITTDETSMGPASTTNPFLQQYISEALESNEGLKQVKLDYASNLAALEESRGMFLPDVSLNARYTVADGGRIIEFPIGDLLNPVYSTLNLLTMSDQFPQVENEEFPFFRPTEHETKVRLVQPIFQSDLIHNVKMRKYGSEIAQISVEKYRRELILEVTRAYYNYQKAYQLHALADTSMDLVRENLRVSKSLYANDKVTIDVVYRSEAEISKVRAEKARARSLLEASRSYFNFLLNRELSSEIDLVEQNNSQQIERNSIFLDDAKSSALENRQELRELNSYMDLNKQKTALYRGANLPGLYGVVDYGFQGEEYSFTEEDDFIMASVVLQWTLFQGRVNNRKVQQSKIEGEKLQSMVDQAEQQIRLDVINRYYALEAAMESVQAAMAQLQSSRKAYNLVSRRFHEDRASLLELIDARTALTGASANVIIARSDYYTGLAEFKYAIGQNN